MVDKIIEESFQISNEVIAKIKYTIKEYLESNSINKDDYCFYVYGSLGRKEMQEASDIDLGVISKTEKANKEIEEHFNLIKKKIEISCNRNLHYNKPLGTPITIEELTDLRTIGTNYENVLFIMTRYVIFSEGIQVAGGIEFDNVKRELFKLYHADGINTLSIVAADYMKIYSSIKCKFKNKVETHREGIMYKKRDLAIKRKLIHFNIMLGFLICILSDNDMNNLLVLLKRRLYENIKDPVLKDYQEHLNEIAQIYYTEIKYMGTFKNREIYKINNDLNEDVKSLISKLDHLIFAFYESLPKEIRKKLWSISLI